MKRITLASATIIGLASPLLAGGMAQPVVETEPTPVVATPVVSGADWTGGYIGGGLGYGSGGGTGWASGVNGAAYSGFAGYNFDMGSTVLVAEIEYGNARLSDPNTNDTFKSLARVKGKIGYDAGTYLPYLTVGGGYFTKSDNTSDWGYVAGGGVDYAVSDSMTIGGEVLYNKWNDFNNSGSMISATTATARVAFHF